MTRKSVSTPAPKQAHLAILGTQWYLEIFWLLFTWIENSAFSFRTANVQSILNCELLQEEKWRIVLISYTISFQIDVFMNSTMSTTLLPFLYQTRTLQRFAARTSRGVPTPAFQAFFHATARQSGRPSNGGQGFRKLQYAPEKNTARKARRPTFDSAIPFDKSSLGQEEDPAAEEDDDEIEGLPLGHRSTLTPAERETFDHIFEEISSRGKSTESMLDLLKPPKVPYYEDGMWKGGDVPPRGFVESHADMISDIFAKIQKNAEIDTPAAFSKDRDPPLPLTPEEQRREEQRKAGFINVIVQDAASQASRKFPFRPDQPLGSLGKSKDPTKALLRFPPSLRKAASVALGIMESDRASDDLRFHISQDTLQQNPPTEDKLAELSHLDDISDTSITDRIAADTIRAQERRRVEAKMREAKTDFELWDVLEEEVFSMVEKLGISGNPKVVSRVRQPPMSIRDKRKAAKKKRGKTVDEQSTAVGQMEALGAEPATMENTHQAELSMDIYGPLYPSYLLSALRLLDQQFARSSPMALNLLPRIKELGLMSYVLGVSSPFYNTLAGILWHRYGDAKATLDLLEEMGQVGLYLNGKTEAVLYEILTFLNVAEGKGPRDERNLPEWYGPFAKEVVDQQEYRHVTRTRLRHWSTVIAKQLEMRRADFGEE